MEPVLTDVTLNHEAGHIIGQAAQAVHGHGGHGAPANFPSQTQFQAGKPSWRRFSATGSPVYPPAAFK